MPNANEEVVPFEDSDGKIAHLDANRKFVTGKLIKSKAWTGQNEKQQPIENGSQHQFKTKDSIGWYDLYVASTASTSTGWLSGNERLIAAATTTGDPFTEQPKKKPK